MRFRKEGLRACVSASVALMGLISFLILPSSLWSRLPGTQRAAAKNDSPVPQSSVRQSESAPVVQNGKITFVSKQDGHSQIYVINPDGSDQTQLTSGAADNYSPAWSPDGMKLAFVSNRDGSAQIYVMNADGSNQTRLTNDAEGCADLAWSPDSTRIAFSRVQVNIFVINADGTNERELTTGPFEGQSHPTWSPDGRKIAFIKDYGAALSIFVINLDNGTETLLLGTDGNIRAPAWSPDGARIAFVGENLAGLLGLHVMNAIGHSYGVDSDGTTTLSRSGLIVNNQLDASNDDNPAWSPDGTKLAFENSGTIYVIEDYRSELTRLVDGTQPAWQPIKTTPAATPPPVRTTLQFDRPFYVETDNTGGYYYTIVVTRLGDTSGAATVDYATSSGTASDRSEFTPQFGTLRFAPGAASAKFDILITHTPSSFGKTINLTLSNPTGGAVLSGQSTSLYIIAYSSHGLGANLLDDPDPTAFVRQQYHDFLNREPDNAGLAFWVQNITSCGSDQACIMTKRVDTSAAFFLSIEFQNTGYFVYRFYRAAYNRQPLLAEFLPDVQQVGQGVVVASDDSTGWKETLEANKQAFADSFVQRASFVAQYGALGNSQYVDELIANTGVKFSQSDRDALVSGLDNGTETRATVLRKVAENEAFYQSEFNPAFVLMQYFGYLRRNPSDAPDHDLSGYNFWLQKLNEFGGDYRRAEMVRAFIVSSEYRQRFGS